MQRHRAGRAVTPALVVAVLCGPFLTLALAQSGPAKDTEPSSPAVSDSQAGKKAPVFGKRRAPETPESLYELGSRQMRRGYHDEAIVSFDKVRNHFPFNQYSVLAELRVADCLYEKRSFLEAVDAYSQFTRLHPRHEEVDYALYRAARAQFRLSPLIPQRDQSNTHRGLKKIKGFESRFPDSEYLSEVIRLRDRARTRLARFKLQIGNFYWKSKEWTAAERRYRMAYEEFPDSPLAGKALYRRALCLRKLGRDQEAVAVLQVLVAATPPGEEESSDRWVDRGRKALDALLAPSEAASPVPVEGAQEPAPADEQKSD